jgi:hypothetical protein
LQYLLDIGYKIIVFEEDHTIIKLLLKKDSQYPDIQKKNRKWSDIMYDVIPFIIQLDNDFYLNNFYNDSILEMYIFNGENSSYNALFNK